ncbi:unnamed protein product [Paramecium pentaurelia]|uniref:protein disulfide-isomerase n=1 Tax=Paramecium pentaurelia TaxID=43138 RepID=A0A8S1RZM5_9CILI|nr:unnamed protein product [Paramecium pentaurelia]
MFYQLAFSIFIIYTQAKEENDLHVVFDKNSKQFFEKNEISMIFFYTPQCGHCERFQPEVEKAAKQLKEEGFVFAKVDGHNYKDIAKQFEVNGFPSVILSQDHGKKYKKFEGPRTSDSVIMWMYEQLNEGTKELKTIQQIKDQISKSQLMYLYMAQNDEDRGFRRYKDYSHAYGNLEFYHTFLENAQQELGFSPTDSLVAYKKYDKSPVVYQPKQIKVSDLKAFIETNQFQRLHEYNEDIAKKIFKQDRSTLILLIDETQMKDRNAHDALKSISLDHPHEDHLLFVKCSITNQLFPELQKQIGDFTGTPALFGLQKYGVYKYKFNQAFTKQNLDQFILDFKNGKAPKHYKSQKLDNSFYSENVEILTGNSYQKVINSSEDWVIFYYNSFDSEHLSLLKEFAEISKFISQISKVKFAIADVTQNEFSDFSDPTDIYKIRLYKGNKSYTKFIQKVNIIQRERLINFIKEHSNHEFNDDRKNNHRDDL